MLLDYFLLSKQDRWRLLALALSCRAGLFDLDHLALPVAKVVFLFGYATARR